MSRTKRTDEEIEEARILGKALAALRVSQGMTQGQVAERAGLAKQRICKAERGYVYPRQGILKRILSGMGATFAALHRAQGLVQDPTGEDDDAPDYNSEEAHRTAVRLAQEAGKAVAHCCLAFMELQALDCSAEDFGKRLGPCGGVPAVRSTHSAAYQGLLGRLRQGRQDACPTQAEVGRRIGARQPFVSKVESGERRLDPVELARFAAVYGKPVGWFHG